MSIVADENICSSCQVMWDEEGALTMLDNWSGPGRAGPKLRYLLMELCSESSWWKWCWCSRGHQ